MVGLLLLWFVVSFGCGILFVDELDQIKIGVFIGMAIVFFYAVLEGMKGITYTQVAQYCVLIFAFMVPAIFLSILMTGNPIPQLGFGGMLADGSGVYLLDKLNSISMELGFGQYTAGNKSTIDMFFITLALMLGKAGLPHVIVPFFTVPKVRDARTSAGWVLFFISILYTTAPAVTAFARTNLITTLHNTSYQNAPEWMKTWETSGLLACVDKNGDGIIQYHAGKAFAGKLCYSDHRGKLGQRILNNIRSQGINELYIDRYIIVLANPEIAQLPAGS